MARVTVEECIVQVSNRFELVMLAAQRARAISAGAALTIDRDNDKNPVVALREIADKTVELDQLRQSVVNGLQRHVEVDEPEEDNMAALMTGSAWAGVPQGEGETPDGVSVVDAEDADEVDESDAAADGNEA